MMLVIGVHLKWRVLELSSAFGPKMHTYRSSFHRSERPYIMISQPFLEVYSRFSLEEASAVKWIGLCVDCTSGFVFTVKMRRLIMDHLLEHGGIVSPSAVLGCVDRPSLEHCSYGNQPMFTL